MAFLGARYQNQNQKMFDTRGTEKGGEKLAHAQSSDWNVPKNVSKMSTVRHYQEQFEEIPLTNRFSCLGNVLPMERYIIIFFFFSKNKLILFHLNSHTQHYIIFVERAGVFRRKPVFSEEGRYFLKKAGIF